MNRRRPNTRRGQRGIVLIASLLLLLVITILALAMFRSMGLSEKISGNVREKQRALHAALVAEQYAEYWLSTTGNASQPPVTCSSVIPVTGTPAGTDAGTTPVLICQNAINPVAAGGTVANPGAAAALPWTDSGGHSLGFPYTLPAGTVTMSLVAASNGSYSNTYSSVPAFYIQYLGPSADGTGAGVYKIDAVGYGGSPLSVAVVESTYEIGSQGRDPTGL